MNIFDNSATYVSLNEHVMDVFDGISENLRRGKIDVSDFHFTSVDGDDNDIIIFVNLQYYGNEEDKKRES